MKTTAALLTTLLAAPVAAQGPHYPGDPYNVISYGGNFTVKKVTLECTDGHAHFQQRGLVSLTVTGIVNKELTDGNIAYQMFEQGVIKKVDQGSFAYFKCTNKGCDPSQPMYMTLENPKQQVGNGFTAKFPLQLPYQQKTGQMTVSVIGSDQDHQPADFTLGVQFNYTNTKKDGITFQGSPKVNIDSIETFSSLLLSKKGNIDQNVQSGSKTTCEQDVDCPSSYCMRGGGKKPPYTCHDCGINCCNSDADCNGSYCMDGPDKTPPFTCHGGSK
jgi:hypothetical protein